MISGGDIVLRSLAVISREIDANIRMYPNLVVLDPDFSYHLNWEDLAIVIVESGENMLVQVRLEMLKRRSSFVFLG